MKISILGPAYPYRGGIATFNERLARQLIYECKDVDIRTFRLQYPGFLFPGKTQYTEKSPPEDIKIVRELNSINPVNWIKTGLRLKKEKPDILLVRYWIPFLAPCLGIVSRIVRSNGFTVVISVIDNVIPHEKRLGDSILTRFFMNGIDGAVVLSESVKVDTENFRKDIPVCLTPHPVFDNYGRKLPRDEALAALNLDPGYLYLLFFGFVRDYKGLDLLIRAFSDQKLRNKKLRLLVVGEFYEDKAPYFELIKQTGREDDIIVIDRFIPDNEVRLYFCSSDLVVQPYKSATQSGVTQIAYHFDKPMLVTDVGGLDEIVLHGKGGYVVSPDPDSIAEAINDYFDNNRKATFSECVRKEKEKFSWKRMTGSITEVFYKIMLKQLIKSL